MQDAVKQYLQYKGIFLNISNTKLKILVIFLHNYYSFQSLNSSNFKLFHSKMFLG